MEWVMQGGLIVIVSGFSGAGKGTVIKKMMEQHPNQYALSVSATTRAPRSGEVPGVHYHYISQEKFDDMLAQDDFLEYASYVGKCYGTPKSFVLENIAEGRDTILEIEVQGAKIVKEKYPDTLTIFVTPPSVSELERRLSGRGTEEVQVVGKRMLKAAQECREMDWYEELLINDKLEAAAEELHQLIQSYKQPQNPTHTSMQRQARSLLTAQIQGGFQEWVKNGGHLV